MIDSKVDIATRPYFAVSYNEPLVWHCQYYNLFLQQTIEDPMYLNTVPILINSATSVAYSQLKTAFEQNPDIDTPQKRLKAASELFAHFGHGLIDFPEGGINENGGLLASEVIHYGYTYKVLHGIRKTPCDFFATGYIAASMAQAYDKPPGYYKVTEVGCVASGADKCSFKIEVADKLIEIYDSPNVGGIDVNYPKREKLPTNIDEDAIINALHSMPIIGNEEGIIPAFGVYIARMYSHYYNRISYEFENLLVEKKGEGMRKVAISLLVEAGHICGLNFYGGVMISPEWYGLVMPMIKTREDWVHGITAVSNFLGWGRMTIKELIPNERMVVVVDSSYESSGYLSMYGKGDKSKCYLMTGGASSIMNHVYHGDITKKPTLNKKYFNMLFKQDDSFIATETKCRCKGDDYCEIEVVRRNA